MAASNFIAFTVVFGYTAVLCCLQLHSGGADTMTAIQAQAVVATLTVAPLLTFTYVGQVVRAKAAGNGGGGDPVSRLVTWLARATFLAATLALLAGAVQLGADGHLDRGRGDVARLNIK